MDEQIENVDPFFSEYFDCDIAGIAAGETRIVASERRERKEIGFGPVFAVWFLLSRNRCAVSTQDRLQAQVLELLKGRKPIEPLAGPQQRALKQLVCQILGRNEGVAIASGSVFYCMQESTRPQHQHQCRAVVRADVPLLQETGLYSSACDQSISEGSCFAAFCEGQPAALCYTHTIGHMADGISDLAVETEEQYRQQGFGKAVVSHTTQWALTHNRTPIYSASDWNVASIQTARSVGYVPYGWQLRIQVPKER